MVKRAAGPLMQAIRLDRTSELALPVQIGDALRELVLSGALAAGDRLPATRTLARELGVARATLVECFERLAAEGILETRIGDGTYVSAAVGAERPRPVAVAAPGAARPARLARSMALAASEFTPRLTHQPRPFTTAMPSFEDFPMAQWARLSAKHWRKARHQVLGYPDPHGHAPLRKAIAAHLRFDRGIECDWRSILIVAGAQDAFQLIAAALIDPGDPVWFENPGAIGARNSFVLRGARLVPVPVDDSGLVVEAGLARERAFRLAFVTPSHQQPLGATLSLDRRLALLNAAEAADGWIVEDDWDGEFRLSGQPLPTLKGIDRGGRVIYVGSFSKSLFPALRLGFMLPPPSLADALALSLEAFSPGVPTVVQAVVADFLAEGHFATHVRRMRRIYAERYRALSAALAGPLARWMDPVPTTTGLHTVAFLKPGLSAARLARAADKRGLTVAPIERFCVEPIGREGVVLGFSGFSPAQIGHATVTLAESLADIEADGLRVDRTAETGIGLPDWP
ncbi:MocR-like pyridoxine biosynthesis transcription factor PdxR [Prosthecodimorpha staleyi]|uniref:MocR-like pyridoxine biosynthesis transcription factor PdxR n=1 Tax=Prosthecodimorpha staleyi TaxID=2840188 RepID=UPI0021C3CA85|nr:PLP-dependent aminotransferase family protein [Prosthecodimorpha staleyi]